MRIKILQKGQNKEPLIQSLTDISDWAVKKLETGGLGVVITEKGVRIDRPGITKKQFNALHVWCQMCAETLNSHKHYREVTSFIDPSKTYSKPWSKESFKEDVYKVVLSALENKRSTKDQDTTDPKKVVEIIHGHIADTYCIVLPPWPTKVYEEYRELNNGN